MVNDAWKALVGTGRRFRIKAYCCCVSFSSKHLDKDETRFKWMSSAAKKGISSPAHQHLQTSSTMWAGDSFCYAGRSAWASVMTSTLIARAQKTEIYLQVITPAKYLQLH